MVRKRHTLLFSLIIAISLPFTTTAQDPQTASQEAGTYRWQEGCVQDGKVCGSIKVKDGLALLSLTAHGVRVDVVLLDTGKTTVIAAAVGNATKHPVFVLPEQISLYDTDVTPKKLKLYEPGSMAKKKEVLNDLNQIITATDLATSRISDNTGLSAVASRASKTNSDARLLREMALKADTIPSQKYVTGIMFFESEKKVNSLLLSVPVGGYVFEFPFVRNL